MAANKLDLATRVPSSYEKAVWVDIIRSLVMGFPDSRHIVNSIPSDVSLNNTANYFDGPTVAQGPVGVWFVSGTVTVLDTSGAAAYFAKLWDGTTVVASARCDSAAANQVITISLSGRISSPAGSLRISVRDTSSTSGKILANATSNSCDSTITAYRLA